MISRKRVHIATKLSAAAAEDLYNCQQLLLKTYITCSMYRMHAFVKTLNLSVDGKKPPRTILLTRVVHTVTASVPNVPHLRTLCDRLCLQLHENTVAGRSGGVQGLLSARDAGETHDRHNFCLFQP